MIVANLALVFAVLLVLEVPLALVYTRHEHDALDAALQRDAAALAVLAGEVAEVPGEQNLAGLARRYSSEPAGLVSIVDSAGVDLTGDNVLSRDPGFRKALDAARLGTAGTGEVNGIVYVAVPVSVEEARSSSLGLTSRSTIGCTSSGSCSSASASPFWLSRWPSAAG